MCEQKISKWSSPQRSSLIIYQLLINNFLLLVSLLFFSPFCSLFFFKRIFYVAQVKMMVVLGELGGRDEYSLVEALKQGKINKPVVAWVSGTCARLFKSEVQFGHAVS